MQPLSPRVRLAYLVFFLVLFAFLLPSVIFYAEGWRYAPEIGLYKTGGIYVTAPYTDVTIAVDGVAVGTTGLIQRSFYIDDIAPASYVLTAERDGFIPWRRQLVVEPQIVTDTRVLLVPTEIVATRLSIDEAATNTRVISEQAYEGYLEAFGTSTDSSFEQAVDALGSIGLFIEQGDLVVRWMEGGLPPSMFCPKPSRCVTEILIERRQETVTRAQFFEGGILYSMKEKGVHIAEADARPSPLHVPLYPEPGAEYRVIDGVVIVKDGEDLYELNL